MKMIDKAIDYIRRCAEVPSFSTFEELLIPVITEAVSGITGVKIERIPDNNLVIQVPGNPLKPAVALTAHLDKINHFGKDFPEVLPFVKDEQSITGQLDDAVGVGLCLHILNSSVTEDYPPLYLLLSEVEESVGLKEHPDLMKGGGKGYHHGIGAERISYFLLEKLMYPAIFITVDTTPVFKENPGIALYSKFWEDRDIKPCCQLLRKTEMIEKFLLKENPGMMLVNKNNDFRKYGALFNHLECRAIPSIAVEPAIHPYHQKNESVRLTDIHEAFRLIDRFLKNFDLTFENSDSL